MNPTSPEIREIANPIVAYSYAEKFGTSLYRMHRYWGRKPANVVAKYIETYCPKGGVVLDPFLGSGTTAIEAIKLGRRAIGLDINPLAVFITKTTLTPVRIPLLEASYRSVIDAVSSHILPLYQTACPSCGKIGVVSYIIYSEEHSSSFSKEVPQQIIYKCSCSFGALQKPVDSRDKSLIIKANNLTIDEWYPINLIIPKIRHGLREARNINDVFTTRNLYSLAKIYSFILQLPCGSVRDCLLLAFSSAIPQCSRLAGVIKNPARDRTDAMGWILTSFRIMKNHVERNPLEAFSNAFNRVLKGKMESNDQLSTFVEAKTVDDIFNGNATGLILEASVNDLPKILKNNRVDYVFTDPPHGPSIQYMKLSSLSNAWLKKTLLSKEEIIQESHSIYSFDEYSKKLGIAFRMIRSSVSDNGRVHVYFRGKNERDWLKTIDIAVSNGFKLLRSIFQPQRYSFRTPYRKKKDDKFQSSTFGDWILHLITTDASREPVRNIDEIEDIILKETEDILKMRGQPTQKIYILMHITAKIPIERIDNWPTLINNTLRNQLGKKFEIFKSQGTVESMDERWFLSRQFTASHRLDTEVEKVIIKTLIGREEFGASRPFIYQAIYNKFQTQMTPDFYTIEKALKKITVETGEDARLNLKHEFLMNKDLHTEVIFALFKLGIEYKFKVYITPKALKRIYSSNLRDDFDRMIIDYNESLVHPDISPFNDKIVKYANVLWIRNDKVHAHFEVEDRGEIGALTFSRGDKIRKLFPNSERVLVVPHKIMKVVRQRLKENNSFWHLAAYHSVLSSYDSNVYKPFKKKNGLKVASATPLKLKIDKKDDITDTKGTLVGFKLRIKCPTEVLSEVKPGHFMLVEINRLTRHKCSEYNINNSYRFLNKRIYSHLEKLEFLRIPLSIYRVHYEGFEPKALYSRSRDFLPSVFWEWVQPSNRQFMDMLVRIVGNGTRTLYKIKVGDTLNAMGPLGKEINIQTDVDSTILISGGVGLASLYPIAHYLRERGCKIILFAGSKDKNTIINTIREFEEMGVEAHITDEKNDKQLVTDMVLEWMKSKYKNLKQSSHIYACGPWGMLKTVYLISKKFDLPCTVLVDKLMMCGVGACMSCVVKMYENAHATDGTGHRGVRMVRSCVEGPAFIARDIVWSEDI